MKYLLKILFVFILLSGNAFAKIKSKDITFPGKYYTKEIKACSAILNRHKESLPPENRRTGLEHCPATSLIIWIASDSSQSK